MPLLPDRNGGLTPRRDDGRGSQTIPEPDRPGVDCAAQQGIPMKTNESATMGLLYTRRDTLEHVRFDLAANRPIDA